MLDMNNERYNKIVQPRTYKMYFIKEYDDKRFGASIKFGSSEAVEIAVCKAHTFKEAYDKLTYKTRRIMESKYGLDVSFGDSSVLESVYDTPEIRTFYTCEYDKEYNKDKYEEPYVYTTFIIRDETAVNEMEWGRYSV